MSAGQTESQTALLRARYSKILKGININDLTVELNRQDLLSCTEKDVVLKSLSGIKKHRELCKALAAKGTSQVGLLSRAIKEFQETPPTSKGKESKQEMEFMARKPLVVKSQEEHHKEGFSGREEAEGKHGYVFRGNGGKANRSRSERANGVEDTTSSSMSCTRSQGQQPTIQAKQEIKDVPDPPVWSGVYVESDSNSSTSDSECESDTEVEQFSNQMEAFVVLFYMTVTQLLQAVNGCISSSHDDDNEHDEKTTHPTGSRNTQSGSHSGADTHSPTDETLPQDLSLTNKLNWLNMDVSLEEIRDYFPPNEIKGVTPNSLSPVKLNMSVILEAFQQFFERFQRATKENVHFSQNAQLVKELIKQNTRLEAKVRELQHSKPDTVSAHQQHTPSHSDSHSQVQNLQKELSRLLEKVKILEPFQTAYTKSEERSKQLVGVTQEWAIECEEKDKLIAVQDTQIKQLQEEIDQLQRRVFKYKKHWMATREREDETQAGNQVDTSQFEEAKLELALRREFQDQVLAEKEEATEVARNATRENEQLKREVEGLRDETEELRDRLGNFKVHAQAKEPTVREMGALSSENRQLKDRVQQLEMEKTSLSDEVLAYKTYVSELTQTPLDGGVAQQPDTRPKPPPPRQTARTQAMVTGYSVPNPLRKAAANRHQQQPHPPGHVATVIPRGPPPVTDDPIIEPHNHHEDDYRHDYDDADTVSTISDDGGDFPPPMSRTTVPNGMASVPQLSTNTIGHTSHLTNGDSIYKSSGVSHNSTGDYTQHIRYPNHSGILVRPLCGDEVSLQGEGGEFSSSRHPPNFYDQTVLSPRKNALPRPQTPNQPEAFLLPGSSLLSPEPLRGKECPNCHHVWLTLGEREFQSHVAGCHK